MLAIDTETTGLWFKHGSQTFAIGAYDGEEYCQQQVKIDPYSRQRTQSFSRNKWREKIWETDAIVMFHAQFDSAALYEAGILTEDELLSEAWWSKVIEVDHLSHLWDSKQIRSNLKLLSKKFLGVSYSEVDELDELVKLARDYCRFRWPEALIADKHKRHPSLRPSKDSFHKMDMWLLQALLEHQPEYKLIDWFTKSQLRAMRTAVSKYLKADVVNTYRIATGLMHELLNVHGDDLPARLEMNHASQLAICRMQHKGVSIDMRRLGQAITECENQIDDLLDIIKQSIPDIKNRVPTDAQVRDLLFDQWELPILALTDGGKSGKNKKPKVDADTLMKLRKHVEPGCEEHVFLGVLLAMKKYDKKLSTFKVLQREVAQWKTLPLVQRHRDRHNPYVLSRPQRSEH